MKTYIQPNICVQTIEASTVICTSVTSIKSTTLNFGGDKLGTQYAI